MTGNARAGEALERLLAGNRRFAHGSRAFRGQARVEAWVAQRQVLVMRAVARGIYAPQVVLEAWAAAGPDGRWRHPKMSAPICERPRQLVTGPGSPALARRRHG